MTKLAEVFKLNRKGLNVRRGLGVLVVMGVPLIVCHVINQEVYYLSVAFGALFVGLNDPGGDYAYRLPRMALNAAAGALLTVLGFAIGDGAWGMVVLAAKVITKAARTTTPQAPSPIAKPRTVSSAPATAFSANRGSRYPYSPPGSFSPTNSAPNATLR